MMTNKSGDSDKEGGGDDDRKCDRRFIYYDSGRCFGENCGRAFCPDCVDNGLVKLGSVGFPSGMKLVEVEPKTKVVVGKEGSPSRNFVGLLEVPRKMENEAPPQTKKEEPSVEPGFQAVKRVYQKAMPKLIPGGIKWEKAEEYFYYVNRKKGTTDEVPDFEKMVEDENAVAPEEEEEGLWLGDLKPDLSKFPNLPNMFGPFKEIPANEDHVEVEELEPTISWRRSNRLLEKFEKTWRDEQEKLDRGCGSSFRKSQGQLAVKRHQKSHQADRKYKCQKGFDRGNALKSHMKVHGAKLVEEEECPECNDKFDGKAHTKKGFKGCDHSICLRCLRGQRKMFGRDLGCGQCTMELAVEGKTAKVYKDAGPIL